MTVQETPDNWRELNVAGVVYHTPGAGNALREPTPEEWVKIDEVVRQIVEEDGFAPSGAIRVPGVGYDDMVVIRPRYFPTGNPPLP